MPANQPDQQDTSSEGDSWGDSSEGQVVLDEQLIRPADLPPLLGPEGLGDGQVLDFWRWALGDLRVNNARGYLAEFLVARAVGDPRPMRVEWGAHDVESHDGTRIEVKATGLLQSWASRRIPKPRWSLGTINAARIWDYDNARGEIPSDPWHRVDVWVFALQSATDPAAYDPLNLTQWEFRVLPHRTLLLRGQKSVGLGTIESLGGAPVTLENLAGAVAAARDTNDAIRRSAAHDDVERWFTATGTIAGTPAVAEVGAPGLIGDDERANACIHDLVAGDHRVAIEGIWTGHAGLDHLMQAAATIVTGFDDGVTFDPPLPVQPLPPGAVA